MASFAPPAVPTSRRTVQVHFSPVVEPLSPPADASPLKGSSRGVSPRSSPMTTPHTSPMGKLSNPDTLNMPSLSEQRSVIVGIMQEYYAGPPAPYLYLVHASWLLNWFQYAEGCGPAPGPIPNWKLVAGAASEDLDTAHVLKADLVEGIDYYLLPHAAYTSLVNWHSGGPYLPRFFFNLHSLRGAAALLPMHPSLVPHVHPLSYTTSSSCASSSHDGINSSGSWKGRGAQAEGRDSSAALLFARDLYPCPQTLPSHMDIVHYITSSEEVEVEIEVLPGPKAAQVSACCPRPSARPAHYCIVCDAPGPLRCTACGVMYYCSAGCQLAHWRTGHKTHCPAMKKPMRLLLCAGGPYSGKLFQLIGRRGKVGLANIGNSCYLNASIQCLSALWPLTAHLLRSAAGPASGTSGPSTASAAARRKFLSLYTSLITSLHLGTSSVVNVSKLKHHLGSVEGYEEYAGNAQQDAHEALEVLLDQLDEALKLSSCKLISALVGSQMLSRRCCPACGNTVTNYEYTQSLQLAIPRNYMLYIAVLLLPQLTVPMGARSSDSQTPDLGVWDLPQLQLSLDRLSPIKMLLAAVRERLPAPNNGDLLLFEYTTSSTEEVHNRQFKQLRPVRGDIAVHHIHTHNPLYAFVPDAGSCRVIVHMRMVTATSSTYIGPPVLLAVDAAWPVRRLQYSLWVQLLRLLRPSSAYCTQARAAVSSKDMKKQFKLSDQLLLRLIRANGWGLCLGEGEGSEEEEVLGQRLQPLTQTIDSYCGSSSTLHTTGLLHLAMDVEEDMMEMFDNLTALDKVTPRTPHPSHPTTRTGRMRYNSTILSLDECLHEHCKEEVLDKDNAVHCSTCDAPTQAVRMVTFSYPSLPRVLMITLKRFEFRAVGVGGMGMRREKIDIFVDFPLDGLDISAFCSGEEAVAEGCVYDLFAVCNHYGRMGFGHYTAMTRDWAYGNPLLNMANHIPNGLPAGGQSDKIGIEEAFKAYEEGSAVVGGGHGLDDVWYHFDDDNVSKISAKEVRTPSAYILFYRRRLQKE